MKLKAETSEWYNKSIHYKKKKKDPVRALNSRIKRLERLVTNYRLLLNTGPDSLLERDFQAYLRAKRSMISRLDSAGVIEALPANRKKSCTA